MLDVSNTPIMPASALPEETFKIPPILELIIEMLVVKRKATSPAAYDDTYTL